MATIKLSNENSVAVTDVAWTMPCLICNESILLDDFVTRYGRDVTPKICDKCKRAIMYIRKELEEGKWWYLNLDLPYIGGK